MYQEILDAYTLKVRDFGNCKNLACVIMWLFLEIEFFRGTLFFFLRAIETLE